MVDQNLYSTDALRHFIVSLLSNTTDVTWVYDDADKALMATISLANVSTDDLSEGDSLYFTAQRAQDAVNADSDHGTSAPHNYRTNEQIQEVVNTLLVEGDNVTLTYDEDSDSLVIDATGSSGDVSDDGSLVQSNVNNINFGDFLSVTDDGEGSVTVDGSDSQRTDEEIHDVVSDLLVEGDGIALSYDDASNSLTVSVTLDGLTTDDLTEGNNLYFTESRSRDSINSDPDHGDHAHHDLDCGTWDS